MWSLCAQRLSIPFGIAAALLAGQSARANTLSFGPAALVSTANVRQLGPANTRSIAEAHSTDGSTANFRAQASADAPRAGGPPFGSQERATYSWDVPYTITRDIGMLPGTATLLSVPLQRVEFSITFSPAGDVNHLPGSLELSRIYDFTIQSLGNRFPAFAVPALRAFPDQPAVANGSPDTRSFELGIDASGPSAGEIDALAEIPTDYRLWEDSDTPRAAGYDATSHFSQSLSDVLRISFTIEALSSPSGMVSVDGGPSIACAGLQSSIENFPLAPNCGDGLSILGHVIQIGTRQVPVPESATVVLLGVALGVLAAHHRI